MYSGNPHLQQLLAGITTTPPIPPEHAPGTSLDPSDAATSAAGTGNMPVGSPGETGAATGPLMLSQSFTAEALEALADGATTGEALGEVSPGIEQQLSQLQLGPDTPAADKGSAGSSSGDGSSTNSMGGHYSSSRNVLVRTSSAPTSAQLTAALGSAQAGTSSGRATSTGSPPPPAPPHSAGAASPQQQQPAVGPARLTRAGSLTGAGGLTRTGSLTRSGSLNNRKAAPNRVCCNALLAAYARAAPPQWSKAVALLEGMGECGGELCPDIVSWNTVIKAVGNAGQTDRAFQVRTP
jgi:hypothetical protein